MINKPYSALYLAVCLALSGCATASSPGASPSSPAPNPSPSNPSPSPSSSPPPSAPAYNYADNQNTPTGVTQAQSAGFTGAGVKIGIMDTGVALNTPGIGGNVVWFNTYYANGGSVTGNNIANANDTYGHGTLMTEIAAGQPVQSDGFAGGVAPNAAVYEAQVCNQQGECGTQTAAYQDLVRNGVHIFNQSYGILSSDLAGPQDVQSTATSIGNTYESLPGNNLYVWSAGDLFNGQPPSDINVQALVPEYVSQLQPNWLVATSVHIDSSGQPSGLSSYAPDCGSAMNWCIAAPGLLTTPPEPGTSFPSSVSEGTSGSAAIITGVAALVQQAYPWFTPANITDDILTTATHLGSGPSNAPNSTYGWGIVNAGSAVNGPAQFAFGNFNANIGNDDSTFTNAISGSGGLVLSGGNGTLQLSAQNTYQGTTDIQSGNLLLTGGIADTVSLSGGSLEGDGSVAGNVTNTGGTVKSGGGVNGTALPTGLSIGGNYTAGASSTTTVHLGDPLLVGGTAALNGTLQVDAPNTAWQPETTTEIMSYAAESGRFAQQTYGSGVFYTVSSLNYGTNLLSATLTRSNVSMVAARYASGNQNAVVAARAVQSVLDRAGAGGNHIPISFLSKIGYLLSYQSGTRADQVLSTLSGEIYPTIRAMNGVQALSTANSIADKTGWLRGYGAKSGAWVQYDYEAGSVKNDGYDGGQYTVNNGLLGVYHRFGNGSGIGAVAGTGSVNGSLVGLPVENAFYGNTWTLGIYGRIGGQRGAYADGNVTWVNDRNRVRRAALVQGVAQPISSQSSENLADLDLHIGDRIHHFNFYADVQNMIFGQPGFSETGGNGFGLTVPSSWKDALYFGPGAGYDTGFRWFGMVSGFSARIQWDHLVYGAGASGLTASFQGAPTAMFSLYGQSLPRNNLLAEMGLNTRINKTWSFYINGGTMVSTGWSISSMGSAGVRARFS